VPLQAADVDRDHRQTTVERARPAASWAITLLREVRDVMTQLRDRR
jgi:hypothetical protein